MTSFNGTMHFIAQEFFDPNELRDNFIYHYFASSMKREKKRHYINDDMPLLQLAQQYCPEVIYKKNLKATAIFYT